MQLPLPPAESQNTVTAPSSRPSAASDGRGAASLAGAPFGSVAGSMQGSRSLSGCLSLAHAPDAGLPAWPGGAKRGGSVPPAQPPAVAARARAALDRNASLMLSLQQQQAAAAPAAALSKWDSTNSSHAHTATTQRMGSAQSSIDVFVSNAPAAPAPYAAPEQAARPPPPVSPTGAAHAGPGPGRPPMFPPTLAWAGAWPPTRETGGTTAQEDSVRHWLHYGRPPSGLPPTAPAPAPDPAAGGGEAVAPMASAVMRHQETDARGAPLPEGLRMALGLGAGSLPLAPQPADAASIAAESAWPQAPMQPPTGLAAEARQLPAGLALQQAHLAAAAALQAAQQQQQAAAAQQMLLYAPLAVRPGALGHLGALEQQRLSALAAGADVAGGGAGALLAQHQQLLLMQSLAAAGRVPGPDWAGGSWLMAMMAGFPGALPGALPSAQLMERLTPGAPAAAAPPPEAAAAAGDPPPGAAPPQHAQQAPPEGSGGSAGPGPQAAPPPGQGGPADPSAATAAAAAQLAAFRAEVFALHLCVKLFHAAPADLPPDAREQLVGWLRAAPAATELYVRNSCVHLTLTVRPPRPLLGFTLQPCKLA